MFSFSSFLEVSFIEKFFKLGITASITITVGSLIILIVFIVVLICCCRRTFCKPQQDTTGTTSTATSVVANGTPLPNQGIILVLDFYTSRCEGDGDLLFYPCLCVNVSVTLFPTSFLSNYLPQWL